MSRSLAEVAGFVLAGGASRRMGTDKALLSIGASVLLQQVAASVRQAVSSVHVVSPPGRYEALGLDILLDRWPGEGPLGGILTALHYSTASWNLIVAVDMPELDPMLLRQLVADACVSNAACLVPAYPDGGTEPLCAMYHRSAVPAMQAYFDQGGRRVKDALAALPASPWPLQNARLVNVNTPEQWEAASR